MGSLASLPCWPPRSLSAHVRSGRSPDFENGEYVVSYLLSGQGPASRLHCPVIPASEYRSTGRKSNHLPQGPICLLPHPEAVKRFITHTLPLGRAWQHPLSWKRPATWGTSVWVLAVAGVEPGCVSRTHRAAHTPGITWGCAGFVLVLLAGWVLSTGTESWKLLQKAVPSSPQGCARMQRPAVGWHLAQGRSHWEC